MAVNLAGIFCAIHPATQDFSPRYILGFCNRVLLTAPYVTDNWAHCPPVSPSNDRFPEHAVCLTVGNEKIHVLSGVTLQQDMR